MYIEDEHEYCGQRFVQEEQRYISGYKIGIGDLKIDAILNGVFLVRLQSVKRRPSVRLFAGWFLSRARKTCCRHPFDRHTVRS